MGLFDSIKDAASSVKQHVSSGVHDAVKATADIRHAVAAAPSAAARGAGQALKGVEHVARAAVKQGTSAVAHVARAGAEHARAGVATLRRGAADIKDAVAPKLAAAGSAIKDGAKTAAKWSWNHKAEIGFWVGTTALMLAVPVTGGASGAMAGGLMAARMGAVGVKVAQMGRAGVGAVKLAKAAGSAVQGARGALGATRAAGAAAKVGQAVHTGRAALGATRVGKVMIQAQKPVLAASTLIAGVNFADTSVRYAKGDATKKDLGLATLGFAPAGFAGIKGLAAKRAAGANEKAAQITAGTLDDVTANAANATDDVAHVARSAPAVNAPQTANVAASARDRAAGTVDKAANLRQKVAVTANAGKADDAISASSLVDELGDVAARANAAKLTAGDAAELAPTSLTPAARAARERLDAAEQGAIRAKRSITSLATKQRHADKLADGAAKVEGAIGTTGLHAFNLNNGIKSFQESNRQGYSLTDGSLAKGVATWILGRNARLSAPVPAAAPAR
ncbi:MAG: hypothetical protein JWM86_1711 [Thermoleophilia bacterium]|nr:hypothetical protein [Thermoleophilia bacterium]